MSDRHYSMSEDRFWMWAWFIIAMELALALVILVAHYNGWIS